MKPSFAHPSRPTTCPRGLGARFAGADSTAVAITSIAVGGTVAISAPIIAGQLEDRRATRRLAVERRLTDIDELRALLDQAAERLHELDNANPAPLLSLTVTFSFVGVGL